MSEKQKNCISALCGFLLIIIAIVVYFLFRGEDGVGLVCIVMGCSGLACIGKGLGVDLD